MESRILSSFPLHINERDMDFSCLKQPRKGLSIFDKADNAKKFRDPTFIVEQLY